MRDVAAKRDINRLNRRPAEVTGRRLRAQVRGEPASFAFVAIPKSRKHVAQNLWRAPLAPGPTRRVRVFSVLEHRAGGFVTEARRQD